MHGRETQRNSEAQGESLQDAGACAGGGGGKIELTHEECYSKIKHTCKQS